MNRMDADQKNEMTVFSGKIPSLNFLSSPFICVNPVHLFFSQLDRPVIPPQTKRLFFQLA